MADWTTEFSRDFEIPGFISFLVSKKVLEDTSWHNDTMPSFSVFNYGGDNGVQLWVDHPFATRREMPEMERFGVTTTRNADQEGPGFMTDDLDMALERLFQELGKYNLGVPAGVFEWRPSDAVKESPWEDPTEYLLALKEEYLETFRR